MPRKSKLLGHPRQSTIRKRDSMPHAKYGVEPMPDYVEPFVAYRAWGWVENGITSLNNAPWTPKVAFEAVCPHNERVKEAHALLQHQLNNDTLVDLPIDSELECALRQTNVHPVPDPGCTCGMYAGINIQHLIDIGYINHGIHGEVYLWGRLYRHTLGWRAQYAYPKNFVVPPAHLPFTLTEIQKRMESLIAFDVDIFLQKDNTPSVSGEKIPFWMKDYGYSQQGIQFLVEQRKKWYESKPKIRGLNLNDRVVVLGEKGGIGIVKRIEGDDLWYTLFNPDILYRKRIKDFKWSDRNWRWETEGLGATISAMSFHECWLREMGQ